MIIRYLITGGLLIASLTAQAESVFKPIELSDPELAQLRGRYVLPDRIISFGVTMTSSWQNSAGQVIGASVQLSVDGHSQPTLTVTPINQASGNGTSSNGTGQVIGGAGLGQVQGIVQTVRTAGDLNSGLNDLRINITHSDSGSSADTSGAWGGDYQDSNGAGSVTVQAVNGGLRIGVIANNNQGIAQQQIGGGGVAQQASISGSLNAVENLASLNVALRNDPNLGQAAYCAWQQLRTLRQ